MQKNMLERWMNDAFKAVFVLLKKTEQEIWINDAD